MCDLKIITKTLFSYDLIIFEFQGRYITHLCLYNLSVIHKKKCFDSELELMTYINEAQDRLHPGEVGGLRANIISYLMSLLFCFLLKAAKAHVQAIHLK